MDLGIRRYIVNRIRFLFIFVFVFISFELFSYDYAWEVQYEIKEESIEEVNKIIENFIISNSEFHVYRTDKFSTYLLGKKTNRYELSLDEEDTYLGRSLFGHIYLKDVNATVGFNIHRVETNKKIYVYLLSYCSDLKETGVPYEKKWSEYISFNDVEPTKKEVPIKESFEKNFLSKLPLEWEYKKTAVLDRGLSKLLSLFRKRKYFTD